MKAGEQRDTNLTNSFISVCVIGQSFSEAFVPFQKRSDSIVSNLIVDTLVSVWTFDCYQIEEEQLQ